MEERWRRGGGEVEEALLHLGGEALARRRRRPPLELGRVLPPPRLRAACALPARSLDRLHGQQLVATPLRLVSHRT